MTSQSNARLERNMSYRKPVPAYVPSPPPSPTIPAKALELEETDDFQSDVPPLPENWREIITTKVQITSSKVSVHTFQKATLEFDPSKDPDEKDQRLLTVPQMPPNALRFNHRRRGLPTHFRSPTPPLPSSKSPLMFPESQARAENIVLPMSPYTVPSSPEPSLGNIQLPDARSLRLSASSQTVVSHGSGHISTSWSRSFGTLPCGEPSYLSIHPKKEVGDLAEILDTRNSSSSSLLCCGFLGNITQNLKDFWR